MGVHLNNEPLNKCTSKVDEYKEQQLSLLKAAMDKGRRPLR